VQRRSRRHRKLPLPASFKPDRVEHWWDRRERELEEHEEHEEHEEQLRKLADATPDSGGTGDAQEA
jgi:hypothetical protein